MKLQSSLKHSGERIDLRIMLAWSRHKCVLNVGHDPIPLCYFFYRYTMQYASPSVRWQQLFCL